MNRQKNKKRWSQEPRAKRAKNRVMVRKGVHGKKGISWEDMARERNGIGGYGMGKRYGTTQVFGRGRRAQEVKTSPIFMDRTFSYRENFYRLLRVITAEAEVQREMVVEVDEEENKVEVAEEEQEMARVKEKGENGGGGGGVGG